MYKLEECYWDAAMLSHLFYTPNCLRCQFGSVFDWKQTNERCVPLVIIVSDLHGIIMCQTKQSLMLSNTFQDLKCLCNLLCSFEFVRSEINTFTLTGARSWSIVHYVHWIWRSYTCVLYYVSCELHPYEYINIRDRPRFFDQVGHQTTNASIGNKDFFTK